MFDVDALKNMETKGMGDVNYVPIPENPDGWKGICQDFDLAERQNPKINDGKPFLELSLKWLLDEEKVRKELERDEVTINQNIILDVVMDGNGNVTGLDFGKGKNVQLNRIRAATGLDDPNKPFKFSMFVGKAALVGVKHTPRPEGEGVYVNVTKVGKLK